MIRTGFDVVDSSFAGPLEGRLNLLLSDKPFSKTYFISRMVRATLREGWVVHYIDLDTFFTVYRRLNILNVPYSENLHIYTVEKDTFNQHISTICSTLTKKPQLIILDSIPAFYHILATSSRPSEVNWRIGLYLALLTRHIRTNRGAILVASLLSAKKIKEDLLVPSYPGGMLTKIRSSTIYELKEKDDYTMELKIIKHERKEVEGKSWFLPLLF